MQNILERSSLMTEDPQLKMKAREQEEEHKFTNTFKVKDVLKHPMTVIQNTQTETPYFFTTKVYHSSFRASKDPPTLS
jgi:hypothetical protein